MNEVNLGKYAPVVTNANIANEILETILNENPFDNEVAINMDGMISMTIECINIIFWNLYEKLGSEKFHENICLKNCSDVFGDFISYVLSQRNKLKEENEKNKR